MDYYFSDICTNQSAPLHGNLEYHTNGSVTYIEYSCDIGYTLTGNNSAYCMADGTWDSTQPSCGEYMSLFFVCICPFCYVCLSNSVLLFFLQYKSL